MRILFFTFLMFFSTWNLSAQVDTLVVFDPLIPSPWLKTHAERVKASNRFYQVRIKPKVDSLNALGAEEVSLSYDYFDYPRDTQFYLKFYAGDSVLAYEGLRFNQYYIGPYRSYYETGELECEGRHSEITFKKSGSPKEIPVRVGEWTYYRKNGKVLRKDFYEDGRLVKK